MEKKTVYIETTVVSYLTARPTGDLVGAAWQKIMADWWETQRQRFELHASDVTVGEAGRGDVEAAARRLAALADVAVLPITEAAVELTSALVRGGAVPARAESDALHVAVAAVHGLDYLLTWNCRHLDNAETKPVMRKICQEWGYVVPEICTPQELMGGAAMADEIIEEAWRIKDEIVREHGYDLGRLGAYYLRLGRERAQREEEGTAAGEGTAGQGTAAGGAEAVGWVQTEFGARQGGGGDRSGS